MALSVSSGSELAANQAQDVINRNLDKFKNIIKNYPGIIAQHMDKIENIGSMNGEEAQKAVQAFCNDVVAHAKRCAEDMKDLYGQSKAGAAKIKNYESFAEVFKELRNEFKESKGFKEKAFMAAKIVGVFFFTMANALIKGAKKAALWIAATGVKVICTVTGFIIRLVTKAVTTARNLLGMTGSQRELKADEVVIDVEGRFVEC